MNWQLHAEMKILLYTLGSQSFWICDRYSFTDTSGKFQSIISLAVSSTDSNISGRSQHIQASHITQYGSHVLLFIQYFEPWFHRIVCNQYSSNVSLCSSHAASNALKNLLHVSSDHKNVNQYYSLLVVYRIVLHMNMVLLL